MEITPDNSLNSIVIDEERYRNKLFSQGSPKSPTRKIIVTRSDVINIKMSSASTQYCDLVFKKKPKDVRSKFYSPGIKIDTIIMNSA